MVVAPVRVYRRICVVEAGGRTPKQMISTIDGTSFFEKSSHCCCVRHGGEEEDEARASYRLRSGTGCSCLR